MKIVLDLNTTDDYRTFLKVKSLPLHSFNGREAWFPDEYAERVGVAANRRVDIGNYSPCSGLFDYQRDISALAIRRRKFAVFADCGLGKTLVMLEFARHCADVLPAGESVLIVSPLMVIPQTIAECQRFYGDTLKVEQVKSGELPNWLASGKGRIGITNYEAIGEHIDNPGRLGALILDESSLLKSHYGRWGQRLIHLGRGLNWKLCLTGTPAPNDRIEYANHAVFLDQFPTVNAFLAKFFVNRGETANRWELKPHALRPFYRALSHWCIFLSDPSVYGWKDNTAPLPPVRTHIVPVPITDAQRFASINATGNLLGTPSGIVERQSVARIAKSAEGGRPEFVANLVKQQRTPCIVWCRFNDEQDELYRLLPKAANISGDTPNEQRVPLIAEYQSGQRKTLISKGKILGFGLNLQVTRRMVFSTLHDSYEEYYQCVKRANRYGSKHPLDVFIPVTELEAPMVDTVLRKADRIQADTREQEMLFKEVGYAA